MGRVKNLIVMYAEKNSMSVKDVMDSGVTLDEIMYALHGDEDRYEDTLRLGLTDEQMEVVDNELRTGHHDSPDLDSE